MWWLACLMVWVSPFFIVCQDAKAPTEDEIRSMLHDAMTDVLAEQADEMSRPYSPSLFNMPDNFMRSFRPGTGIGNREELVLEAIYSREVFSELPVSSFLYKRFNHSDYIVGISSDNVFLSKVNSSQDYISIAKDEAIIKSFDFATVKDVEVFTRFSGYSESLYIAVLVETAKTYVINVYELFGNSAIVVAVIDLKINPATSYKLPKKIAYVQSSLGGSLVVLVDTVDEVDLNYKQEGSNELNHYIEVNYPSAVDLITFTVRGHGYIAVARDNYCEIFKMNEAVKNHTLFDKKVVSSNIVDLGYFRIGFHYILMITDLKHTRLYTWKSGEFEPKQDLPVQDVVQVYASSVESCRDEVILLMVKTSGEVLIYAFSGQEEKFKKLEDAAIPENHLVTAGTMTSFTSQSKVIVLFLSVTGKHEALVIETSMNATRDPVLVEGEKVSKTMKEIQDSIYKQTKEIEGIKRILEGAVRRTGHQTITGVQHFNDISTTTGAIVEEVNKFVLEWEDSKLTLDEYRKGAEDLEKDLINLENLVKDIEKVIPDLVLKDENAVITGQKIFTGNVGATTLQATSLNIAKVGGVDLKQIQADVYRLDKPQRIEGTLTFAKPLTITGDLDVDGTVNGIDIGKEVMTIDTDQTSYAKMTFKNTLDVTGNLKVSGLVNGIDIGKEVVTIHGDHHITGRKEFLNGIEADDVHTTLLDGIIVDDLYRNAFTISGNQNITADKTFSKITTNDIVLHGRLNGHDIEELAKNIVRADKPATITGYKIFTNDVVVDGELTVKGTVNGLNIPGDLFLKDDPQPITGHKEFLGQVTANALTVQEKIDGIKIPEDIVTLTGDEEITSTIYFADGIYAKQNIVVEGLVDGVNIQEIAKQAMKLNESNEFPYTVFLGPVNVAGDLTVNGFVNNVNLTEFAEDIVFKNEHPIEINARKNFKTITADKVELGSSLNGYNINVDFMKVRGDQRINGTKTFKQGASFNDMHIEDGKISGLSIGDIYRQQIILAINESEIDHDVEFADRVIVTGNLDVIGKVDGLKIPDDIVLRTSTQDISNKHFANKVVVDNLIVDGDITVDTLGGRNLTEFYNDRITLTTDQTIDGDLWLDASSADKVAISGLVNGMDINAFARNVMSKTKNQTITAVKEFAGDVIVHEPITTREGVNGFNLADIKARAFKLEEDNIVTAPLEFEDNITFASLEVSGDINGVNVTRLAEDSLKKSGLQHVKGDTVFNAGFHVEGDIHATTVNGLNIPEDVLLKTRPQEITGQFTLGSAGIAGSLSVVGSINGLKLREIAPKLATVDDETVIESDVTFTRSVHVFKDIEVTGTVNEVDFKALFDSVLRKTGDQTIQGNKIFRGNVTIKGDIGVRFVNEMDWQAFSDDVVWTHIPQVVRYRKTFEDDVSVRKDVFVSGHAKVKLINGINLNQFIDEAVFVDTPTNITGPIIFKSPVEIAGDLNADLINGLQLKTDVITIMCSGDGPQAITGQKTFQKLKVYGDIYADTVNSYNLQELEKDTLLTEGDQTIEGAKVISGDVVFKKNVYPDKVNDMMLNRDLVTLATEQEIEGSVTFQGDVFVENDLLVKGLLNGVDLQKISNDAVYLGTDQVIEGSYSFENAVATAGVEVQGNVNDIDLRAFDRNVTEFFKDTSHALSIMQKHAGDHCEIINSLQESLKNSYYALDSFVMHQELDHPASFINVKSGKEISILYLDEPAKMATAVQNVWDEATRRFHATKNSTTDIVRRFSYEVGKVHMTIKIGIDSEASSFLLQGQPSNVPSGFTDASVVIREDVATVALLFSANGTCNIYLVKGDSGRVEHETSLFVGATSIVMFELSDILYLAVASAHSQPFTKGSSNIYSRSEGKWQKVQHIPTYSSPFVKHFTYHNYHYLALANNAPMHDTKEPMSIQIYRNSGPDELIFGLFQKFPFAGAKGIELFQFGDVSQLHLVAWNETIIQIFALEGESGMRDVFTIHGKCVKEVKPLFLSKELYLIVGQQNLMEGDVNRSHLYRGVAKGVKYEPYNMTFC